jgi:virulence-associated protein VagC
LVSIPEVLQADGRFGTLLTAVGAANLGEALSGEGPFTLLAPTDDAFAKIPAETLNAILADVDQLTDILLYHALEGSVESGTVVTLSEATTLQGQNIAISVSDGQVRINDSIVIQTDILASNGIVHVIDSVLIPADLPTENQELSITISGDQVIITWPVSGSPDRALESAQSIADPQWIQVNAAVETVDGSYSVTLPLSNGSQFFRLSP